MLAGKYLVRDRATNEIIQRYSLSMMGWEGAVQDAAVYVQLIELYPSGVTVERRNDNGTVKTVITMTNGVQ